MTDLLLCGWRVRSALPLPELPAWDGDGRPPDVEIVVGRDALATAGDAQPLGGGMTIARVGADGARLAIPEVGRILVVGGRRVTIAPAQAATDAELRAYLLGSVLAALAYQRGLLPLHASCLLFGDEAVAVAGASGAGKSTLAATLALRGVPMLAEDVCVVDASAPGGPLVLPSVARLKLWRDALDRLGVPVSGLEPVRRGVEKYALARVPTFRAAPTRLAALHHLSAEDEGTGTERVVGLDAVRLLHASVYRVPIARALGCEGDVARGVMALLAAVACFRMMRHPSADAAELATRLTVHRVADR